MNISKLTKHIRIDRVITKVAHRAKKKIVTWNLRRLATSFMLLGLAIIVVGSYLAYTKLYMTNERKFWLAVDNSLATKSVTRELKSGGSGNQVVQSQRFAFAPQMATESKVSYVQKSAVTDTSVVTEGVSFPDSQYQRYVKFKTNQTNSDGQSPTLDTILGKWEQNKTSDADLEQARLNYVSQLVTLAVFGNYDANFRHDVMSKLKNENIYTVNFNNVREDTKNGEAVLTYSVSVGLKGYAAVVQKAFTRSGYGNFPPLNPEQYQDSTRVNAEFIVSKKTNNIVGINFGSRSESYSGYGINKTVERPNATFNQGELEQAVQKEIQGIL